MASLFICVSGNGSTLQSIIDFCDLMGRKQHQVIQVVADRPCYALERAQNKQIPKLLLDRKILNKNELNQKLAKIIQQKNPDIVILAGYLSIVGSAVLKTKQGQGGAIWNIHPSLLPKFGGMGMYGMNVHRAVIAAGETESGCTLHCVSKQVDAGDILAQKKIMLDNYETAESLAVKVQAAEKQLLLDYLNKV